MPGESMFPGPEAGAPDRTQRDCAAAAATLAAQPPAGKLLYAVDATLAPGSPAPGAVELTSAALAAVRAGGGHVLSDSHHVFPNGAVTLVLILAESHLAIHTWPEEHLIAVDLFSCGAIDGERVIAELAGRLGLTRPRVRELSRG